MARRVTQKELDELAVRMSTIVGREYTVEYAYGSPRIYTDGGSREVSPRMTKGQLAEWMMAFLAGAWAMKQQMGGGENPDPPHRGRVYYQEYEHFYEAGKEAGYGAAKYNDDGSRTGEELREEAFEAESNARQFSPFEFLAKDMNDADDPDSAWESYDDGVSDGITEYLREAGYGSERL